VLRNTTIGIVLTAALLLGAAAAAGALSRDKPISGPTTLTYGLKGTGSYFNDVDPSGPSIGDQLTSHNLLLKDGKSVGHLGAACTDTGSQLVCTAVLWAQGGQIALTGQLLLSVLNGGGNANLAVTGGTGAFRHVHGQATIENIGGSQTSKLVLTLTP
jgi:hypothetical protein